MLKHAVLHREAAAEAEEAISFLNNQRDGLGDEFRDELELRLSEYVEDLDLFLLIEMVTENI